MRTLTVWRNASWSIRWISGLWFFVGLLAIVHVLYSWLIFSQLPVTGMTERIVVGGLIEIALGGLIAVSAWQFLRRRNWARSALEVLTWLVLLAAIIDGVSWIALALHNWPDFEASVAAELPEVRAELKLAVGIVFSVILIVISVLVIRALRSPTARRYVASIE